MSVEALVEKYIALRDAKGKVMDEAKAKAKKLEDVMDRIEGVLLAEFQVSGAESVKTACGTAYKTTKTFASVGDWPALIEHIMSTGQIELLKRDVVKDAVKTFMDESGGDLPPGVTWREEIAINVRRS